MKTVCVTGASGYIGSWLVKSLLHRGYTVHASVRDLNDIKKTAHLLSLEGADKNLHLFQANLLEEGSFDAAIDGCQGVFHTASPVGSDVQDPQAELIDPAVKGTLNVLRCCARTPSVKKVVLTSSLGCNVYTGKNFTPDDVIDETWWSLPHICTEMKLWYVLSKTLAEEAAWKFATDKGIDMVAMNPGMVIGPLLQPKLHTGANYVMNLINGNKKNQYLSIGWIDVRDVANAHILAFENLSSKGRYCLVEGVKHYFEIIQMLRKLYSSFKLPTSDGDQSIVPVVQVSKEKAKSLGLVFTSLEQSIKDTIESFIEKGILKPLTKLDHFSFDQEKGSH